MKKLPISLLALLSIVFAVTSAFTTHKSVKDAIGYFINSTQTLIPVYDSDVTTDVQNVGVAAYKTAHCVFCTTIICFAKFQDGVIITTFKGLWHF